ncbi:MAG: hypothetical protein AB7U73_15885 [Pirellulales bacterium]
MIKQVACAAVLVLVSAGSASAQWQYPAYSDGRVQPRLEQKYPLPPYDGGRPARLDSRPFWYIPAGTVLRFRFDRLILADTCMYSLGEGATMANQFMYIAPSPHERLLSRETSWTVKQVGAVWYRDIFGNQLGHHGDVYGLYRLQKRHRIYMLLESEGGTQIQLEICPAGVTPSVANFETVFDLELPPVELIP